MLKIFRTTYNQPLTNISLVVFYCLPTFLPTEGEFESISSSLCSKEIQYLVSLISGSVQKKNLQITNSHRKFELHTLFTSANLKAMITNIKILNRIRWTARITGSLLVAFTVIFVIIVLIDSLKENTGSTHSSFSTIIITSFIIWGFALSGLVIAIWNEGLGGCISLFGLINLSILNFFNPEAPNKGGALIIFAIWMIPSLLYICYWLMSKNTPNLTNGRQQLS